MRPQFDPIMLAMGRAGFRGADGSAPTPTPAPARVVVADDPPALADGETADWFRPATGVLLHLAKAGGKVYGCEMTEM